MSDFIPDTPKEEAKVPFFEDAKKEDGWQGHTTTKSIGRLQAEITNSMGRMGGMVSSFRKGRFGERDGYQIVYMMETPQGTMPGRINIAALPLRYKKTNVDKRDKALRMALYMLREALDGTWMLQQLSPGYAPLMPFMVADKEGHTISEKWNMSKMLPDKSSAFDEAVEADVRSKS